MAEHEENGCSPSKVKIPKKMRRDVRVRGGNWEEAKKIRCSPPGWGDGDVVQVRGVEQGKRFRVKT